MTASRTSRPFEGTTGDHSLPAAAGGTPQAPADMRQQPNRSKASGLWLGVVVGLAADIGWYLLAVSHPMTTYHFDPLLVTIAPFALIRLRAASSVWRVALAGCGVGAGLAFASTLLMQRGGALHGPVLFGPIDPVTEAFIGIVLGMVIILGSTLARQVRRAR